MLPWSIEMALMTGWRMILYSTSTYSATQLPPLPPIRCL
ncbi:Uncharacterised protein [Mycobacteroides abscessus subsp. abscessus]|nr:Uncharacterised protein [Mycobacteroides abscessus subsp. abscessus]